MFDLRDSNGWVTGCTVLGVYTSIAFILILSVFDVTFAASWKLLAAGGILGATVGIAVVFARYKLYTPEGIRVAVRTYYAWNTLFLVLRVIVGHLLAR